MGGGAIRASAPESHFPWDCALIQFGVVKMQLSQHSPGLARGTQGLLKLGHANGWSSCSWIPRAPPSSDPETP